ncbi:MAG: MmcQ/YjbR family DNA-binding protein [Oscillospiraceae bacterium]|nr:MmcQ/YjbR family DNA-binding protein [Oscillospiraceae bacterium]
MKNILRDEFVLEISADVGGRVASRVTERETGDEYALYKTNADGAFVGTIREECENVLTDIADKCFEHDVFKMKQSRQIIDHVRRTYGDELEFLWEKFPDNAVWRRKDSGKWYGAVMVLPLKKLGLRSDETSEIIDLRISPDDIEKIIDNKNYFPGWHMNKKSWYTIILDERVSTEEIYARIDESYVLAKGK